MFGKLPLELRHKICAIVFDGQIIHCYSTKGHSQRHRIARASSPISPCNINAFEEECLECCESDFESVIGAAKVADWSHVVSCSGSQDRNWDASELETLSREKARIFFSKGVGILKDMNCLARPPWTKLAVWFCPTVHTVLEAV